MKTQVYLLNLIGPNQHELRLVSPDVWAWATSKTPGRPANMSSEESCWMDTTTPPDILELIRAGFSNGKCDGVWLTAGSWANDRLLIAPEIQRFYTIEDLDEYLKANDVEILDDCPGYIY